jgi:6-phosphogluconolactonase
MMKNHLEVFQSSGDLVRVAAAKITGCLHDAITARGIASLALSGGSTPRSVYELLATEEYRSRIEWSKVHLFWGDERCVPPYQHESNFRMVNEALIKNINIPQKNVHRIAGELEPREAAGAYEEEVVRLFKLNDGEFPEFDVLLLGLGEDGHVASLFPNTTVLAETSRRFVDVHVEKLMAHRITMTLPVINHAAAIIFLVSGKSKAAILQEVFREGPAHYPAQLIEPVQGKVNWFVDQDAASQLQRAENP